MSQGAGRDAPIRHQLAVLRRRWPLVVVLAVLACGVAGWLTSRQAPVYRATAAILLQPRTAEQLLSASTGGFSETGNEVATEIEVMRSQVVVDAVKAKLGRTPEVSIEARGSTNVLDIHALSTEPATAAAEATTFAEVYVDLRKAQRIEDLSRTGDLIRSQITDLDKRIDDLEKPLRDVEARLLTTTNTLASAQLRQQRDSIADGIRAERNTLERRRSSFDDQLNQLQLLSGFGTSGGVQLVSKAQVPASPISASPLRNAALGLLGGLLVGLGLAFLLDQLDDRLRRKEELEGAAGVPVLGLLPRVGRRRVRSGVVTLLSPSSPTAEAYRTLRTSLQFMAIDRPIRSLQVTSPTTGEGKTTVVTNLAASFAQAGQRVILVDCDLRKSRVHDQFGISNERGFTSVLLDQCTLADVITTVEDEPFLAIVPAGPVPPNPSELLATSRALEIIDVLRENCDILLVDSPPVLPVTDALVISRHVDATLLVARTKRSTKRQVARAHELLDQVGAPLVGTVLNGVVHDTGDGYGYGYMSYGEAPARRARRTVTAADAVGGGKVNGAAPAEDEPLRAADAAAPERGARQRS
jgi:succinoglycan biosynthesis transport protein ExoP